MQPPFPPYLPPLLFTSALGRCSLNFSWNHPNVKSVFSVHSVLSLQQMCKRVLVSYNMFKVSCTNVLIRSCVDPGGNQFSFDWFYLLLRYWKGHNRNECMFESRGRKSDQSCYRSLCLSHICMQPSVVGRWECGKVILKGVDHRYCIFFVGDGRRE